MPQQARLKTVVLLGIGHTNAHVVKQWASDPIADCRLVCISKFPTATYSGMLPGTLGGQFEPCEMRIDLPDLVAASGGSLLLADANGLDLQRGELRFADREPLPFDALSIGVGSMPIGWERHRSVASLITIKPMQTFLQRLHDRLDQVDSTDRGPIRVVVVGGGVASVEIALCLQQDWTRRRKESPLEIRIVTADDHVARGMRPKSVRRIERLLRQRSVSVAPGQRVTEVVESAVTTEAGQRFPADCVVWATGAAPPPVLETLGLPSDDRGFIATRPTLQSVSDDRVFAVGDSGTVVDHPSPKAGVYAVRQSPILWHNLRSFLTGRPLQSFKPQNDFLKLLNTGDGKALLEYHWLTAHARWCWSLKTWIDRRFIQEFQVGPSSSGPCPSKVGSAEDRFAPIEKES